MDIDLTGDGDTLLLSVGDTSPLRPGPRSSSINDMADAGLAWSPNCAATGAW